MVSLVASLFGLLAGGCLEGVLCCARLFKKTQRAALHAHRGHSRYKARRRDADSSGRGPHFLACTTGLPTCCPCVLVKCCLHRLVVVAFSLHEPLFRSPAPPKIPRQFSLEAVPFSLELPRPCRGLVLKRLDLGSGLGIPFSILGLSPSWLLPGSVRRSAP